MQMPASTDRQTLQMLTVEFCSSFSNAATLLLGPIPSYSYGRERQSRVDDA